MLNLVSVWGTGSSLSGDPPTPLDVAHLRLLERAAATANQSSALEEAAETVLAEVCRFTGWPSGRLYAPRAGPPDRAMLTVLATWPPLDEGLFPPPLLSDVGLPGRVIASGELAWIPDLPSDPEFPWAGASPEADAGAGLGVPVVAGGQVEAVLEFSCGRGAEPPDEALVVTLIGVADHLARLVVRARRTEALRLAEERSRAAARFAREPIVTLDRAGKVVSFNRGAERTFGYTEAEVIGLAIDLLIPDRAGDALIATLHGLPVSGSDDDAGQALERTGVRRDGAEFPLELSLSAWETSEGRFYTMIVRDISDRLHVERERETFERQLAHRALHDPLTSLPNRALLADRMEHALARASRRNSSIALLCLDLDRFKGINDGYGHYAGDQLLMALSGRLQGLLRPDDTVARIGGDEFAILCEDVGGRNDALVLAERVERAISAPFRVEDQELTVTATIGVAVAPGVSGHSEQLLRDAEMAMEQARQRGRGQRAVYDESMRTEVAAQLAVEHDLRVAIRDHQLRLYYQPIVDLDRSSVSGVEALVRWDHPTRGLLLPQEFVARAEESGLIVPLGRWVLEQACRQGAVWQQQLGPGERLRVSVNVSARQFQQPNWADEVAHALLTSGFEAGQLVLEITESVLMEDTETTSRRLAELRELGVCIAIDDFGTGYSSLGYLRQFPFDILKVDKSFIDGVAEGPHESALARAVIKLAATLKMDAVAEGVSNRRQVATLRRLRCRFAQGYYFARPQPPEAIDALLANRVIVERDDEADDVLQLGDPLATPPTSRIAAAGG
jgi:diguanylate cyclase (GGDEF)-like protein/PAS domain S-box-containing protein